MNLLGYTVTKLPSVINDPFKKSKITYVTVTAQQRMFNKNEFIFYGIVKFENGNTKGQQDFEGESFDDVVLKIKAMIDNFQ